MTWQLVFMLVAICAACVAWWQARVAMGLLHNAREIAKAADASLVQAREILGRAQDLV